MRTKRGQESEVVLKMGLPGDKQPVRVELVGLLPVLYQVCVKCQVFDHLKFSGVDYVSEQLDGYPEEVRREQKELSDLCMRLMEEFGNSVDPIPVGLMSPRGLWLSLSQGLRGPAIIIDRKEVFPIDAPYERVKGAILRRLSEAPS